jgi:hypothetical protein
MTMCLEGGTGADVEYVEPKDNRGAGSWISNKLEKYPDGTKVKIVVKVTVDSKIIPARGETPRHLLLYC